MTRITKNFKFDNRYKDGREKNYKTQIIVFIFVIIFSGGWLGYDYIINSKELAEYNIVHQKYHTKAEAEKWFFTVNYSDKEYEAKKIVDSLRKYNYSADLYFIPGNEYDGDIGDFKESQFERYVSVVGLFDSKIEAEGVRNKFLSDKRVWKKYGWLWNKSSQLPKHYYEISNPLKTGDNVYGQINCSYK